MSATAILTTTARPETKVQSNRQVRRTGAVVGVAASAATAGIAAAADGLGVPIQIAGKTIPLLGFAQLTLFATVVGVVMASVMARRAKHARHVVSAAIVIPALADDVGRQAASGLLPRSR